MAKKGKSRKSNTLMYLAIAVAAVAVAVALWWYFKPSPPLPPTIPPAWANKNNSLDTKVNRYLNASVDQYIHSPHGNAALRANKNGTVDIVVDNKVAFHTDTPGVDVKITLTREGYLQWAGMSPTHPGVITYGQLSPAYPERDYVLAIADDGTLHLQDSMGETRPTYLFPDMLPITKNVAIPPAWANKNNSLDNVANKVLKSGDTIHSKDNSTHLSMQTDGNLVLYAGDKVLQATGTNNSTFAGGDALFKEDGSIIVHAPGGKIESFLATDKLGEGQYVMWVDGPYIYMESNRGIIYVPVKLNTLH
jgi:hypothetical protein